MKCPRSPVEREGRSTPVPSSCLYYNPGRFHQPLPPEGKSRGCRVVRHRGECPDHRPVVPLDPGHTDISRRTGSTSVRQDGLCGCTADRWEPTCRAQECRVYGFLILRLDRRGPVKGYSCVVSSAPGIPYRSVFQSHLTRVPREAPECGGVGRLGTEPKPL